MKNSIKKRVQMSDLVWKTGNYIGGIGLPETEFKKENIFHKEFKNFGRLDPTSRAVSASIAVILNKRGLYPTNEKLNIPLFFSSHSGPLSSDYTYYNDFLQFGGTAGRANLFVYTLPSSPLGEASVHFGLTDDLLFVDSDKPLQTMCNMISDSCSSRITRDGYLVGLSEKVHDSLNTLFIFFEEKENEKESLLLENISQIQKPTLNELKKELQTCF